MLRLRGAWTVASALSVALWLEAPPSHAAQPTEEVEVGYTVVSGAMAGTCPAEESFLAIVRRHTSKWRVVGGRADVRTFRIRLAPHAGGVAGTLVVVTPGGKTKTRELVGPECDAVAQALAVVMALAIDPDARLDSDAPLDPDARLDSNAPLDPDARLDSNAPLRAPTESRGLERLPEEALPSPARSLEPRRPPLEARVEARPKKIALTFAVEASNELTTAVVGGALLVVGAAFDLRVRFATVPSWLAPSLAFGVRQSFPKHLAGNSEFVWTAATIRFCPVRVAAYADRVSLRPCAEADLGVLQAEARRIPNARSESSRWFDLAGSLRGAYAMNASWSAGASVAVVAPRTRNRYALATGELISQPPAVGVTAGLFLELQF